MPAVVPVSLLASFLFASSAALQQRAAGRSSFAKRADSAHAVPGVGLLAELVQDRLWVLGWTANISGFCVQAAALHLGSVAEVQPLMVCQLLFALPLGLIGTGRRMSATAWWGAAGICAGLAALLSARGDLPAAGGVDRPRLLLTIGAMVLVAGVLTMVSLGRSPTARAVLFGVAAGMVYALTAVLMKESADRLVTDGFVATAADWCGFGLAAATLSSLLLGQAAYASGPLAPALTAMNITNPMISCLLAVLLYAAPVPSTTFQLLGVTVGAALIVTGVVLLARTPTLPRPSSQLP
ncbi:MULTISPECIES: DMT family transporter [unclassified Parafrankia]|uniref:DMT family transporter n=1 Tax=unclassified Parafrankia TaxID=2994368 RepID=UPI000DA4559A|nr:MULTISPECIES: DMT family transporter [unclassified Parafrankia]TCJ34026.1 hypothetical protein E0504_35030 [Parafrankia sp. BMG5.11]SQD99327.1 putative integral membrane protein [Parafrankia sp. Ea1.12]